MLYRIISAASWEKVYSKSHLVFSNKTRIGSLTGITLITYFVEHFDVSGSELIASSEKPAFTS